MDKYNYVVNDKNIIELYKKISEYEDKEKGWAHHDLNHVINVANLVEKILTDLKYDKNFIEEAKIASILHDTGCIEGKDNHPQRGYEFAKRYLKDNNIKLDNEELVLEAIKIHSEGFETDNVMALALIFSDKLDIKYTRVAKEGYNIEGMRQMQYIKDILIDIENDSLRINFICNNQLNKKELEEYYFTKKVFKAIIAFSNKMNLKAQVLINDNNWSAFDNENKENKVAKRK